MANAFKKLSKLLGGDEIVNQLKQQIKAQGFSNTEINTQMGNILNQLNSKTKTVDIEYQNVIDDIRSSNGLEPMFSRPLNDELSNSFDVMENVADNGKTRKQRMEELRKKLDKKLPNQELQTYRTERTTNEFQKHGQPQVFPEEYQDAPDRAKRLWKEEQHKRRLSNPMTQEQRSTSSNHNNRGRSKEEYEQIKLKEEIEAQAQEQVRIAREEFKSDREQEVYDKMHPIRTMKKKMLQFGREVITGYGNESHLVRGRNTRESVLNNLNTQHINTGEGQAMSRGEYYREIRGKGKVNRSSNSSSSNSGINSDADLQNADDVKNFSNVWEWIDENPIPAAGIALGGGFLLSELLDDDEY